RIGHLPFTRRHVFEVAMHRLGEAYGWGGYRGNRDCSRYLMDVFATFGVRLSRHSSYQSKSGTRTVELKGMSDNEKAAAIRQAGKDGLVLLYMPGHIMLYLGEDAGRPWAVSSLSEFLVPCGDEEQVKRVDRVAISDLELGRSTSRKAFLQRLTRLAIFGAP
ncbi:MAG: hypothetical protein ACI9WU_005472, partial [Myxococcota bacterium]